MSAADDIAQTDTTVTRAERRRRISVKPGPSLVRDWGSLAGIAVMAILLLAVAPAALSDFRLNNLAKYCCWAIAAVGIGLAWGRGGMLVMGQGVFFALGAYSMGMHLQLEAVGPDAIPTFMIPRSRPS